MSPAQPNAALLDCLHDIVVHRDAKGRMVRVNPAFCAFFGGRPDDWKGRWFAIGIADEGADQQEMPPPVAHITRLRRYDSFADTLRGSVCFEWQESTFADGSTLVVGRDITHRRAEEDHLRDERAAMAASARAREQVFATLTHEFRTPLNGVLGMATLLRHSGLDPEQSAYVDALETSGRHLLGLVNNILDTAQLEAGQFSLKFAPFSPGDLVQELAEFLSPRAREKGLELTAQIGADTPRQVIGDVTRVRQILFNLAGNAIKFTASGGVCLMVDADGPDQLRFSVHDTGPGIPEAQRERIFEAFAQVDNSSSKQEEGAGLGLAIVRRLVEAMDGHMMLTCPPGGGSVFTATIGARTEEAASAPDFAGRRFCVAAPDAVATSLMAQLRAWGAAARRVTPDDAGDPEALLLVALEEADDFARELARYRGGLVLAAVDQRRVLAEKLTGGYAGWIIRPWRLNTLAAQIDRAWEGASPSSSIPLRGANDQRPPPVGSDQLTLLEGRALVVEDNPINAMLSESALKRLGMAVCVASSGEMALELASDNRFDVIFMDMRMPGMDGLETTRRLRTATGPNQTTPVVALTANATPADRAACLDAGMNDFLTKPVDREGFHDTITRLRNLSAA